MTRLQAAIQGRLDDMMKAEARAAGRAVTRGITRAASGLQRELRGQTRRAGLGTGVEKAWSFTRYPRSKNSINTAALVYSKATRIHAAFSADTVIRARNAQWLVLPTDHAIARGWHLNHQRSAGSRPRRWANVDAAERALGKLGFVMLPGGGRALLVHRDDRGQSIPLFLLVRRVSLKKRLDFDGPARKWADRAPGYILREWERATA